MPGYRCGDNALNFFECWTDNRCMVHFSFGDDVGSLYSRNQRLHHCGEKDLCARTWQLLCDAAEEKFAIEPSEPDQQDPDDELSTELNDNDEIDTDQKQ